MPHELTNVALFHPAKRKQRLCVVVFGTHCCNEPINLIGVILQLHLSQVYYERLPLRLAETGSIRW
jgi:hypothetical protein